MESNTIIQLALGVAVVLATVAGAFVIWWDHTAPGRWFGLGVLLLSGELVLAGLGGLVSESPLALSLQRWRLAVLGLLPTVWLVFSLAYSRGNAGEFLTEWRVRLLALAGFQLVLIVGGWRGLVTHAYRVEGEHEMHFALGAAGMLVLTLTLITLVLILMNLERTFRAAVGTMRWRIKLVVSGVGLLFAVRIYTTSQAMLYRAVDSSYELVNAGALVVACTLVLLSLRRTGRFSIDVYPSHAFLHRSLTLVLAGAYLLLVGGLAKLVTALGGDRAFPLKAFLVLAGLVVLVLLLLSDRVRQGSQRFVSRHLRRPQYDYRQIWHSFTVRLSGKVTEADLCRETSGWLSETFNLLSVTVWLVDESGRRLVRGGSTVLSAADAAVSPGPGVDLSRSLGDLRGRREPFYLDSEDDTTFRTLRDMNPRQFPNGGRAVVAPLVAGDGLVGVLALGDRVGGLPFSVEEIELLRCVADQAAISLRGMQLSRQLLETREMEAFQTMSTFFVHDLKNTANTLSLMLQNLPKYYANAEYREDALRSLDRCVERINQLVGQLAELRKGLELQRAPTDLVAVIRTALQPFELSASARIRCNLQTMQPLEIDPDQVQRVITNLVLNGLEATAPDGWVEVVTTAQDGWAGFSVRDNGPGMSPEFMAKSLFKAFQTTKKRGIGIGLFQCKAIIEAHGGRIDVESELHRGTTFRVEFPMR